MPPAEEEPADRRPIARLRRVSDALGRLELPHLGDIAWFVGAAGRYEAASRAGLSLDLGAALGLDQRGRSRWCVDELRQRRDALLRELHARHYPGLTPGRAASAISQLARQVEQAGLQKSLEAADDRFALIAEAMVTGRGIPGTKQIARLLEVDMK